MRRRRSAWRGGDTGGAIPPSSRDGGGLGHSLPPSSAPLTRLLSPCHPSQSDAEPRRGGRCPPGSHSWQRGGTGLFWVTPLAPLGPTSDPRQHPTLLHQHPAASPSRGGSQQVSQQFPGVPTVSPVSRQPLPVPRLLLRPGRLLRRQRRGGGAGPSPLRGRAAPAEAGHVLRGTAGTRCPLSPPCPPGEQPLLGHHLPVLRCSHHSRSAAEAPGGQGWGRR